MKISLLIPCYNEEMTIARCIESCLNQTRPADEIIVVNDGSTDGTIEILRKLGDKITIVDLKENTGNKSYAQEIGLQCVTGDIFITTDADTILTSDFIERIVSHFDDPEVMAAAGYIKSIKHNWITACRELDYVIGQDINKRAQSNLNALMVIPGCSGAFRTDTFRKYISFDHDTVTEDLDFTYKYHLHDLKIFYDSQAIVYTQDPATLQSYMKQMRRWIGGGWQNILKHWQILMKRPGHALEVTLMYAEGVFFGILFIALPAINIFFFFNFFIGYFISATVIGIYGLYRRKRTDLLIYSPLYAFVLLLNSYLFFEQFMKEIVLRRKNLIWFKPERRKLV